MRLKWFNWLALAAVFFMVSPAMPARADSSEFRGGKEFGAIGEYVRQVVQQAVYGIDPNPMRIYSVQDYGAIGDGVADDTAAVQAAIDAAGEAGGGVVFLPPGTYSVSRTSPARNYNYSLLIKESNVTIEGSGMGVSILKMADGQNGTILRTVINNSSIDGPLAKALSNIRIANLTIDGNWNNVTWAGPTGMESSGIYDQNGLTLSTTSNSKVENVHVKHIGQDGISGGSNRNLTIVNSIVEHTGKNNIAMFQSTGVKIVNNTLRNANDSPDGGVSKPYYNTSTAKYSSIAFAYSPVVTFTGTTRNFSLAVGNKIETSTGRGISADYQANNLLIESNIIESTSGRNLIGLQMPNNVSPLPSSYLIANNILSSNAPSPGGTRTISAVNLQNLLVTGNVIQGGGLGIVLDHVANSTIEGNIIGGIGNASAAFAGINIRASEGITVNSNDLQNSTVKFTVNPSANIRMLHNQFGAAPTGLTMLTDFSSFNNQGYDPYAAPLTASFAWNAVTVPAGGYAEYDVSVQGALPGQFALAGSNTSTGSLGVSAMVVGPDLVRVVLTNLTGSAISLPAGNWRVQVMR
ncbi:glycosyl hydrolase family 28-related protein [Paenibacillus sp. GYB004]|uniref:right-handed parallel beta-helix repeat-containing protein n=1 Tax=Paenibacillus sp. GYB004 TaxID=2994393 RepID=UPI002F96BE50